MKILLREYEDMQYVWKTATYNGSKFVVNGHKYSEHQVVSIINDNRKNYVRCSRCGKLFPKNGRKFDEHREKSKGINPCLNCGNVSINPIGYANPKYIINDDGTVTRKISENVELLCCKGWTSRNVMTDIAINSCALRQCENATTDEVVDTFTKYPGLFDDIITVDRIIENGYDRIEWQDNHYSEYTLSDKLHLSVMVNKIGIVDRFYINYEDGCSVCIFYSKKYNKLFFEDGNMYGTYDEYDEDLEQVREYLAKLYR